MADTGDMQGQLVSVPAKELIPRSFSNGILCKSA